jgi:hypothetical protein
MSPAPYSNDRQLQTPPQQCETASNNVQHAMRNSQHAGMQRAPCARCNECDATLPALCSCTATPCDQRGVCQAAVSHLAQRSAPSSWTSALVVA